MHCHPSNTGGYSSIVAGALVLAVTNHPASWHAMSTAPTPPTVCWAAGLHPCELLDDDRRVAKLLAAIGEAPAIGEVGLDYSQRARSSRMNQRRALDRILASESAQRKVVTLHSVGATSDVIAALRTHNIRGAVLHWFLGSPADVDAAIELDALYSVNVAMFRSKRGRFALDEMPPNRVLAETDAPFAKQGSNPTRPGDVESVERNLARLWGIEWPEVRLRLWSNLATLQSRLDTRLFP